MFNSKARRSTAGSRKKGKQRRKQKDEESMKIDEDSNAAILVPKTKEQKEQERGERVKQEVCT